MPEKILQEDIFRLMKQFYFYCRHRFNGGDLKSFRDFRWYALPANEYWDGDIVEIITNP